MPNARRAAVADKGKEAPESPRSLSRLLRLFEVIAVAPEGLTLADISASLDSPKSSLLLMLKPLAASLHLVHEDGRYRLGPTAFRLAQTILRGRQSSMLLRAFMQELWTSSGETVILTAIDREAQVITYVECMDSPQLVRYTVPAGTVRPLYCSAAGQVLLAFQEESWQENYLRHAKLRLLTPKTITDRVVLRRRLSEIRANGLSVSISEAVPGAAGFAVPIRRADGQVSEALLLAGPAERLERDQNRLCRLLIDIGSSASVALGGREPTGRAA